VFAFCIDRDEDFFFLPFTRQINECVVFVLTCGWMNLFNCSDELKLIPQRIQNKKLSKLMSEFTNGVYGELD
jgi:hypothetical protein